MNNIEELVNKEDLTKLSEIRQDILKDILFYNIELTKILDYKERYEMTKMNTILCNQLVEINNKIRTIQERYSNNFNFYKD
jgi:hypothetical protein